MGKKVIGWILVILVILFLYIGIRYDIEVGLLGVLSIRFFGNVTGLIN